MPKTRVKRARISGIKTDIAGPGVVVDKGHPGPARPAIGGAVHAPFGIRSKGMAKYRSEGDVGIGGVDDHRANVADLLPDMLPGFASVGGFEAAHPGGGITPDVGFAGADINHIGVGWRHGDGTDGRDWLIIKNRLETDTAITRFPNSPRRGGRIVGEGVPWHSRNP